MEAASPRAGPGPATKIAIVLAVAAAAVAVVLLKPAKEPAGAPHVFAGDLPRLVEVGGSKCTQCRLMKPVLEELRKEHEGRLVIEVVDLFEDQETAEKYGVDIIPTQLFLDPSGKELFRHEGFFSKNDILKKWGELGFPLRGK